MKEARILNAMRARRGRALFLLAALFFLATIVEPQPRAPAGPADAWLTATPVRLDEGDARRRRSGALLFLRGWELRSEEPRFGGLSAMHVENGRVTALSDAGTLLRFPLPRRAGRLPLRVEPLAERDGGGKWGRDTEALAVHSGRAWVAFEGTNTIARYRRTDWRPEARIRPAAMRRWPRNSGAEAMVRLAAGRFLVFAEGGGADTSAVLLFRSDPSLPGAPAAALRYRSPPGFRVTDAAQLPDGRLLILHRRARLLHGFAARLTIAELGALRPGAIVEGREIAQLAPPLAVDNMEALSVAAEGGRIIVRLASDNNFMAFQRTLLLEFALEE